MDISDIKNTAIKSMKQRANEDYMIRSSLAVDYVIGNIVSQALV